MLPVLLEELKSASLPEKQQGREKREGKETGEHAGQFPAFEVPAPCICTLLASAQIPEFPGSQFSSKQSREGPAQGHHFINTAKMHSKAGFI